MSKSRWGIRNHFVFMAGIACLHLGAGMLLYKWMRSDWKNRSDTVNVTYLMIYIASNVFLVALVGFIARRINLNQRAPGLSLLTWLLFMLGYLVTGGVIGTYSYYSMHKDEIPLEVPLMVLSPCLMFIGWRVRQQ